MNILISWVGLNKDFVKGQVSRDGPNYRLHALRDYAFEKHFILFNREDYQYQARLFEQKILESFKHHRTELKGLIIDDERDLNEVQNKVAVFLKELEKDQVTILISTGTSIFKIAWYVFASSLQQNIRLIQYRDKSQDFAEVQLQRSSIPYSLIVNEQSVVARKNPASISGFYESPFLEPMLERASKIAIVDNTVLITGDTGTGKEQLARFIHDNSTRKGGEFVSINCSSFNDEILSSELFGHVKGAFTGAVQERIGVFEQAKGGTVFLDEIGDISQFMQQSLLRVLQEKKIQKLGSAGKDIKVNVRIVAATNKNLLQKVKDGTFREDLYYRLAVNEIELASLKDWPKGEKLRLIEFLIDKKAKELKMKQIILSKEAEQQLLRYQFPGNIRELENMIAGLYPFRTEKQIEISDLPKRTQGKDVTSLKWNDVEAELIKKVLKITRGNQSEACREIGMALNTLKDRIKKYNITVGDYK
jgi:transcriptional regulator with PAS, ATPase and Fis domain